MRAWSWVALPLGLMPGVTMRNPVPEAFADRRSLEPRGHDAVEASFFGQHGPMQHELARRNVGALLHRGPQARDWSTR